ncbi:hypothetical protein JCM3775_006374 [Rhodotorula graminis]
MQWVSKAVNYYQSVNPSTLTGAIDVIVVERPTESGDVELACSPFHVRFGKLSVLRPVDKKVRITVNDERVPFYMKVGETGEAFFVFETEQDVPADMQTSPLSGPVSDDGRSDGGDMEPLDLDAPADEADEDQFNTPTPSHPSSPDSSRYTSLAGTSAGSPASAFRSFPATPFMPNVSPLPSRHGSIDFAASPPLVESPVHEDGPASSQKVRDGNGRWLGRHVPSPVERGVEKVAGVGVSALQRPLQGLRDAQLKGRVKEEGSGGAGEGGRPRPRRSLRDENDLKGETATVPQPDETMRAQLNGLDLDADVRDGQNDPDESEQTGDAVIRAARHRDADMRALLLSKEGAHAAAADGTLDLAARDFKPLEHDGEVGAAPEQSGALMLDMSGYKVPGEKNGLEDKATRVEQELEGSVDLVLDEKAEKDIIAFTQALLQSTDPNTLRDFFEDDEAATDVDAVPPIPPLDLDDASSIASERKPPTPRSRLSSRASSPPPRPVILQELNAIRAEVDGPAAPEESVLVATSTLFTLKTGGQQHVFELSLCGSEGFEQLDKNTSGRLFRDSQLTYRDFMEQEAIPDSPDLVIKYAGRYLTWDNASPVLASLAVYRKSLVEHPELHRSIDESTQPTKASGRRGWGLWWGRSRGGTAPPEDTQTASSLPATAQASPPTSPPDSPRSEPALDAPTAQQLGDEHDGDEFPPEDHTKHYAKTLRLTSDQLRKLKLKKGMNQISFTVRSSYSGYATCTSRIFLWDSDFRVVISDIDGTITKSDALGHVFTMIGRDWTHLGVAKLYTDIARNGYKLMYLTSRAIGQADTTREYLKNIKQNGFQLPDGPVIMSPDRLMTSLHREVIMRKPEVFKMACLRDIARLFGERSPFYAGFGNRITDALSYRSVDIPSSRIFTIDSNGEVKMELLELAGYKSSYIHMTDLVDQMFPPINRSAAPEYTDFNYWRAPLPAFDFDIPELAPPSPALSARSDQSTSRISLTRLGSLASSLSRRSSRGALSNDAASVTSAGARTARGATPSSPLLQATVPEVGLDGEEEYDDDDDEGGYAGRSRSSSMPGSLPNESDFERYRAQATAGRLNGAASEAEAYKKKVQGVHDDGDEDYDEDEAHEDEGEEGPDDFGDQLDFSSVPYL